MLSWLILGILLSTTLAFPTLPQGVSRPKCRHWKSTPFPASRHDQLRRSSISASMLPHIHFSAASVLLVTSHLGMMADKVIPNIGILVTLISAAFASNLHLVPTNHHLYDLCWSTFLPASLVLMMIGDDSQSSITTNKTLRKTTHSNIKNIRLVGYSFLVGSIGSILGCIYSFTIFQAKVSSAAIVAGCLSASYIGGSVNFFATAKILGGDASLITSMAAVDLLVMAIYLVTLSACLKWRKLNQLFWEDDGDNNTQENTDHVEYKSMQGTPTVLKRPRTMSSASALLVFITLTIVQISNHMEAKLASILPGTACGIICLLTSLIRLPLTNLPPWKDMQAMAKQLSSWSFQLLFAAIGISANLGQALSSGPTCLLFSIWALIVHSLVVLLGSLVLRHTVCPSLRLEHVLVASNAAIGGPATAAAFCGQLGLVTLTVAATLWGVIGYAIGTGIGVTVTRSLLHL